MKVKYSQYLSHKISTSVQIFTDQVQKLLVGYFIQETYFLFYNYYNKEE